MLRRLVLSRPKGSHGESNQTNGKPKLRRLPMLPPVRELERRSVRQTLLDGISSSFAKDDLSPSAFCDLDDRLGSETMVLLEEEEKELREANSIRSRQILAHHFCRRIRQRHHASQQLQAAMGLVNDNPFVTPSEPSDGRRIGDKLHISLDYACRLNGYRKLQLAFLTFQTEKTSWDLRGEPLGSVPPIAENAGYVKLGTEHGSLTLYESNVPNRQGHVTTWTWLKICRPLEIDEELGHLVAPVSPEEQEAWVIIAIPKPRTEMLGELRFVHTNYDEKFEQGYWTKGLTPDYAQHGGAEHHKTSKIVRFRCGRNGMPNIATSKGTGSVTSAMSEFRADFGKKQWEMIQAIMMRNSCHIGAVALPDTDWMDVAPEPPGGDRQRNGRIEVNSYEVTHAPRQMIISSDVRKPSNLRHEVLAEDC